MTRDEFNASLRADRPPIEAGPLALALWHDAKGAWAEAHQLTQATEGPGAALVHAYLHRKEGDLANAQYWYRRAGAGMPAMSLQEEWESLVQTVLAGDPGVTGGAAPPQPDSTHGGDA